MNDINKNCECVQSIFTRLDDTQDKDDALLILKKSVEEELLAVDQYEKLVELGDLDLPAIAHNQCLKDWSSTSIPTAKAKY